ncbi:NAD(P)/FAD-dependent oxidoreductase [Cupriavidus agavae]|uniref:NADH dehydrogenase n=1 Tax=Cupriavidus agavae TaxID=1001822 RepID=A0A4Q7RDS7_9BURK|nr:FAD-dependent oxidoreductase [Cupriavidus agavae]RZT31326.1 NADH dehydrogenase [Cupriavidus agavae]
MKTIVVVGGGFAGLWAAAAAVRMAESLDRPVQVTLVNRDDQHSIRVRNYEEDLAATLVPLREVLDPIGVALQVGNVTDIDARARTVKIETKGGAISLPYDKLILASGSKLVRPQIANVDVCSFDIDTYGQARRLHEHIASLPARAPSAGQYTAVVVGSGATGVELACELPARLRAVAAAAADGRAGAAPPVRVVLVDSNARIAGHLGGAQAVIEQSCRDLGIELVPGATVQAVDANGLTLGDGTHIPTATVVWCAGMRASDLTACFEAERDVQGRLMVDAYMRVAGVGDVYAAGDVAHALIDGEHPSVMSCQHARPMGRYAGHNAVCELFGEPLLALNIDWYTNIIDLGPAGAVYSQGWDREVVAVGEQAKATKQVINCQRIYPPRHGNRADILEAAAPALQRPPVLKPISGA